MKKGFDLSDIILRYSFLLLFGFFGIELLYYIFRPLTSLPSFYLLKLIYSNAHMYSIDQFWINGDKIILVDACIAGAAYYLLLILNVATPMKRDTRFKSLSFLLTFFLIANILRIVIFSYLYLNDFKLFDLFHMFIWYAGSTIFVVILWFTNVKLYKIKSIPIFSDFSSIYSQISKKN